MVHFWTLHFVLLTYGSTFVAVPYCFDYYSILLYLETFLKKILFIYLTEIETASERGNTSRGSGRGRSRLPAEEPNVGLDPTRPGSHPEPKAGA